MELLDLSLNAIVWVPVTLVVGIGSGLYIYSKLWKQQSQRRIIDRTSIVSILSAKSQVIAHKGAALDGPENTLGAIRKAAANGADGIEMDIMLTKDNKAVLMHDYTVDRTTDGVGRVKDFTYEEINKLDAAAKFDGEWDQKEPVPLMEEAVKIALENNMFIFLDVKDVSSGTLKQILELYQLYPEMYKRSVICAFDYSFLYRMSFADPLIELVPLYAGYDVTTDYFCNYPMAPIPGAAVQLLAFFMFYYVNRMFIRFNAVSVSQEVVDRDYKRWWSKRGGVQVVAWTVNKVENKDYLKNLNVSIITDQVRN